MGVQHRDPRLDQPGQRRGDDGVQRPGALRAAEDQQHRAVGGQAEVRAGGRAQGLAVQRGHRPPQRDPEHLGVRQPAAGHRGGDPGREPGTDLVRQSGPGVGLVHDDRGAAARGEVGGQRDVAAEPDDDVRVGPAQHLADRGHRRPHLPRQPQQVAARLAGQRHRRDQLQRVAACRDEAGVEALLGAQGGDDGVRAQAADRVGERQRRLDVPGGASARDDDRQRRR